MINTTLRGKLGNVSGVGINWTPLADYLGTGFPTCSSPNAPCLTASQFAATANQHDYGNVPRNSFRGPNYFNADLTIKKTIALRERYKFTVGAAFFNVLNHANFNQPYNNLGSSGTFGQILDTVSPYSSPYGSFQGSAVSGRIIQTMLKFDF